MLQVLSLQYGARDCSMLKKHSKTFPNVIVRCEMSDKLPSQIISSGGLLPIDSCARQCKALH